MSTCADIAFSALKTHSMACENKRARSRQWMQFHIKSRRSEMLYICCIVFLAIQSFTRSFKLSNDELFDLSMFRSILGESLPDICMTNEKCVTGAHANCNTTVVDETKFDPSLHDGSVTVSCLRIHYKLPDHLLTNKTFIDVDEHPVKLLIGVLTLDRERRQAVRDTWGNQSKANLYFIMGGPFEKFRDEFYEFNDMIWYDKGEDYLALTYKVGSLLSILELNSIGHTHMLKTDDDTYVNVPLLRDMLRDNNADYFGRIQPKKLPIRKKDPENPIYDKFVINRTVYPEEFGPAYCEGMGYVVTPKFSECLRKELEIMRYHPFEDIATGLAAERCNISLPMDNYKKNNEIFVNDFQKYRRKYMNVILMHHPLVPAKMRSEMEYTLKKARSIEKRKEIAENLTLYGSVDRRY